MLKLSITLPNNAQINLESEDSGVINKMLGMVLLDITRDMLLAAPPVRDNPRPGTLPAAEQAEVERPLPQPAAVTAQEPAVSVAAPPASPEREQPETRSEGEPSISAPTFAAEPGVEAAGDSPGPAGGNGGYREAINRLEEIGATDWSEDEDENDDLFPAPTAPLGGGGVSRPVASSLSEQAFIDFCRAANPLGDMRRVVVTAEGASRYLGMDGVAADELGQLFDLVGWPRAHNFVQTLRNAARSKFGWLERVPGRAGYYSVTDLGRATALGR